MLLFTTVLAYRTRRYHNIVCENAEILTEICASRFGYTNCIDGAEPNWGIYRQRHISEAIHEQMRYGNVICVHEL